MRSFNFDRLKPIKNELLAPLLHLFDIISAYTFNIRSRQAKAIVPQLLTPFDSCATSAGYSTYLGEFPYRHVITVGQRLPVSTTKSSENATEKCSIFTNPAVVLN